MATDSRGVVSEFDFEELANQLLEQGLSASPAELHGCLCGLLVAGAPAEAEAGLAGLCHALDLEVYGELAEQVMALYVSTARALQDDELGFHLLLLDDGAGLASRTSALAAWCRSFLSGYAQVSAVATGQPVSQSQDITEILSDLAAIAEVDLEEVTEDEESEKNYAELVEYIRFAALNAYAENAMDDRGAVPQGAGPPQLH